MPSRPPNYTRTDPMRCKTKPPLFIHPPPAFQPSIETLSTPSSPDMENSPELVPSPFISTGPPSLCSPSSASTEVTSFDLPGSDTPSQRLLEDALRQFRVVFSRLEKNMDEYDMMHHRVEESMGELASAFHEYVNHSL